MFGFGFRLGKELVALAVGSGANLDGFRIAFRPIPVGDHFALAFHAGKDFLCDGLREADFPDAEELDRNAIADGGFGLDRVGEHLLFDFLELHGGGIGIDQRRKGELAEHGVLLAAQQRIEIAFGLLHRADPLQELDRGLNPPAGIDGDEDVLAVAGEGFFKGAFESVDPVVEPVNPLDGPGSAGVESGIGDGVHGLAKRGDDHGFALAHGEQHLQQDEQSRDCTTGSQQ